MSLSVRHLVFFAAAVAAVASLGLAENGDSAGDARVSIVPRPSRDPRAANSRAIRLDVKVVQIPVTVTDPSDHPVAGLRKDDFHLFEDDVEQQIVYLSTEEAPASVGLIFDASGSMRDKIGTSVAAVEQFFNTTLPGDEFLLVRFSTRPDPVTGFTADTAEISSRLRSTRAEGWTALHDAIYLGVHKMKAARNPHRALLILSDGGDNNSRYSAPEIRELVREADIRVYSISLLQTSKFLERISDESGGRMIRVHKMADLPDAINKLSRELRGQYVLGYYSSNPENNGRYRKVRVHINQPAVHSSWRHGYYAPAE
jgi:Ca-activated chloride channel family protein